MSRRRTTPSLKNECNDCGYTWYPKGHYISSKCPSCGSKNVIRQKVPLIVVIIFILIPIIWNIADIWDEKSKQSIPTAFMSQTEVAKWYRECKKVSSKEEKKEICLSGRESLLKLNNETIKNAKRKYNGMRISISNQLKNCKKMKKKESAKLHKIWLRDSEKWWKSLNHYSQRGGESPGFEPPAAPEPCVPIKSGT